MAAVGARGVWLRRRGRGVTLLLTLVILCLLATLLVRFQADTSLQVRASSHRVQRQKCRYAAESGIIVGQVMVSDIFDRVRETHRALFYGEELDPNLVPAGWNRFLDPNATWADRLAHETGVVERQTIMVGDVEVTIEVQDENAKVPLLWLFRSPFESARADAARRAFERYGRSLDRDAQVVADTLELARTIAAPLPLPPPPTVVPVDQQGASRRRRHLGLEAIMAEDRERHRLMAVFANSWFTELFQNPEKAELIEPLGPGLEPFALQLGAWGATTVNINTAPAEVLLAAFEPIGITPEMVDIILAQRAQEPFTNVAVFRRMEGLSEPVRLYLRELGATTSDTFSLHVTAQMGRVRMRLVSGVYRNRRGELLNMGIITRP